MVTTRQNRSEEPSADSALGQAVAEAGRKRPSEDAVGTNETEPVLKRAAAEALKPGQTIRKEATLVNQNGDEVRFQDLYKDKGVVIFMYPKANTPGCTKQACGFRDKIEGIRKAGYEVYGLGADTPKALASWKEKKELPFDLLSDPEHHVIHYLGSSIGGSKVQRSHIVILRGGIVGDVQSKVSPDESVRLAVEYTDKQRDSITDPAPPEASATPAVSKPIHPLSVGSIVDFHGELQTEDRKTVKVQDLVQDHGVVLFIFPKADTPGCTIQATGFNDHIDYIKEHGYRVYGLSGDTPPELKAWKEKLSFGLRFLSDPGHTLISYLGSSKEEGQEIDRSHVIILPGGKIGQVERQVEPADSFATAVEFVKSNKLPTPAPETDPQVQFL